MGPRLGEFALTIGDHVNGRPDDIRWVRLHRGKYSQTIGHRLIELTPQIVCRRVRPIWPNWTLPRQKRKPTSLHHGHVVVSRRHVQPFRIDPLGYAPPNCRPPKPIYSLDPLLFRQSRHVGFNINERQELMVAFV